MTWHMENKSHDKIMRVPSDSLCWREFDKQWPSFAQEDRNVRLGLAMDGVNPFSNNTVSHSTWPIMSVIYNLPPWLSIHKRHVILSAIIPGTRSIQSTRN